MNNPVFLSVLLIFLTVGVYMINKKIFSIYPRIWLLPVIISPLVILLILYLISMPLSVYNSAVQPLIWFLGPAVSAFAIPIYEERKIIFENSFVLLVGVVSGIVVNIISTALLCKVFPVSSIVESSMISHAISAPFAIAFTPYIRGDENLAAVFSIMTAIFGMLIGEIVLLVAHIKDSVVRGVMYGTTSSVMGTYKAMEIGQKDGVMASMSMILSGVIMILLGPIWSVVFKLIKE
ncbi:MAG: hypothetical protein GKC53_00030 [Neisseriaceae bacterium]|nr:MAG: hypothetical protein GKC53_00030 [Neisseriaceae bacterium]